MSDEEFYRLTPRQFDLLDRRFRERLAHAEMIGAFTTAAVVNHSMFPPKEPVIPLRYMPNANKPVEREQTEEELEAESDYNRRVLEEAARQRAAQQKANHG